MPFSRTIIYDGSRICISHEGVAVPETVIDLVEPEDMEVVVELYNQIFRPHRNLESFERRFMGRYNVLRLIARRGREPVGFFLGFELKPTVFFAWFYGVLPEYRRMGIASQLMEAVHEWARDRGYEMIRFECHNQQRPMLHLAVAKEYDMVGLRWDSDRGENLVIFEKVLG
jgi:GNAT superfamily N-acetyltransferase